MFAFESTASLAMIVIYQAILPTVEALVLPPSNYSTANITALADLDAPLSGSCVNPGEHADWRGVYGTKFVSDCSDALWEVKQEVNFYLKTRYDFYSKPIMPSAGDAGFFPLPQGASVRMF